MDSINRVRRKQAAIARSPDKDLPEHRPDVLYIGCVDARLDPIDDLGFRKGQALIFRTIAAQILEDQYSEYPLELEAILRSGEIPLNASLGAVLEFFINHIPSDSGKLKHIIISSHTDCGGLKACWHQQFKPDDRYLKIYLHTLKDIRATVLERRNSEGLSDAQVFEALEKESTRRNFEKLLTYPVVRKALEEKRLKIHGWVIDTASGRICEMDPITKNFEPMSAASQSKTKGSNKGSAAA